MSSLNSRSGWKYGGDIGVNSDNLYVQSGLNMATISAPERKSTYEVGFRYFYIVVGVFD